ncbi:hypothetical protein [Nitrosopumilus ureiphilus]|uniref:Uncharacterized protein n=1 Tax=Nitrosopumilus ureiphilus TaxID=1470067 RepID=A0A7D5R0S8_9ARCH|nr:hypothetical protein [Nitrosopumilus ureiphilus]QLH06016.1 hypothetical protein C5F50_02180 [Nitrosopumilus ureiphilus]
MVGKKPVNVILQMIFAVIPILNFYASYKIQKLRLWFLIFGVGGFIFELVQTRFFFGEEYYISFGSFEGRLPESVILFTIIFVILQVFVMRIWSKKWNESFIDENKISQ